MNSVAAWGSVPDTLNYIEQGDSNQYMLVAKPVQAMIRSGIGITYCPETQAVSVVTVFCNADDKFIKNEAYIRMKGRLKSTNPATLLWKGTYTGDPNTAKTKLFVTMTTFFKNICRAVCGNKEMNLGPFPKGAFDNVHGLERPAGVVPVIRATLLGWIDNNEDLHGDVLFTNRMIVPAEVLAEMPDVNPAEFISTVYQEFLQAEEINAEFVERVKNLDGAILNPGCQTEECIDEDVA